MKTKKTIRGFTLISLICTSVLLASCVSSKKYDAAVKERDQLKAQVNELTTQNKSLNSQVASINSTYDNYRNECETTKRDCDNMKASYTSLKAQVDMQNDTLEKIRNEIYSALADFINKGVFVEYKNGQVYVSMEENLLYKSGSSEIGKNGIEALKTLATVLNDHPKVKVDVVGHTDTIMYKGAKDNWALSVERSIGVVRVLRDNGVEQTRMTASGKSKFDPVASNATPEGRAKNRRTEIVLRSDYEKMWKETVLGR